MPTTLGPFEPGEQPEPLAHTFEMEDGATIPNDDEWPFTARYVLRRARGGVVAEGPLALDPDVLAVIYEWPDALDTPGEYQLKILVDRSDEMGRPWYSHGAAFTFEVEAT